MEVVKVCKHHGPLDESKVRRYIRNRRGRSEETVSCKICHSLSAGKARAENREKANAWAREDRKKNPEKYKLLAQNYKKKNWQKISVNESLRFLGLKNEEYLKMVADQENKCAICKKEETRKSRTKGNICRLVIDHNHVTGKVRGLLCHHCNVALGSFKDDVDLIRKAITYLQSHEHQV